MFDSGYMLLYSLLIIGQQLYNTLEKLESAAGIPCPASASGSSTHLKATVATGATLAMCVDSDTTLRVIIVVIIL